MPNTHPPIDNPILVRYLLLRAKEIGLVNIFPVGAITVGLEGKEMAEYGLLKEAGVIALSDDGRGVQDARLLYLAFQYAQYFNLPFILHEEDENLSRDGEISEGKVATLSGKRAIPRVAEESLMARDLFWLIEPALEFILLIFLPPWRLSFYVGFRKKCQLVPMLLLIICF